MKLLIQYKFFKWEPEYEWESYEDDIIEGIPIETSDSDNDSEKYNPENDYDDTYGVFDFPINVEFTGKREWRDERFHKYKNLYFLEKFDKSKINTIIGTKEATFEDVLKNINKLNTDNIKDYKLYYNYREVEEIWSCPISGHRSIFEEDNYTIFYFLTNDPNNLPNNEWKIVPLLHYY